MNFELIYASKDCINVIRNLMQFYNYDFSEYINHDVEEGGLYKAYPDLEKYLEEEGYKFPYIIKKGEKYVWFVLVSKNKSDTDYFSIAEFFILKKYRREGIGQPRNFGERLSMNIQMGSFQNVWKMEEGYKTL